MILNSRTICMYSTLWCLSVCVCRNVETSKDSQTACGCCCCCCCGFVVMFSSLTLDIVSGNVVPTFDEILCFFVVVVVAWDWSVFECVCLRLAVIAANWCEIIYARLMNGFRANVSGMTHHCVGVHQIRVIWWYFLVTRVESMFTYDCGRWFNYLPRNMLRKITTMQNMYQICWFQIIENVINIYIILLLYRR